MLDIFAYFYQPHMGLIYVIIKQKIVPFQMQSTHSEVAMFGVEIKPF